MIRNERLECIERYVMEHKYASTEELMKALNVSKATVRRDLSLLSDSDNLKIVRGGVMQRNTESTKYEPSYDEKIMINEDEKRRIAKRASELISEGTTIVLDSGTTILHLTEEMNRFKQLVVATCDVRNAVSLAQCDDLDVMMIGGGMIRGGFFTVIGSMVEKMIRDLNFNQAFISCDAVNIKNGVMITNFDEVQIKQSMIASSHEVILLVDHGKIESVSFGSFASLDQIDKIITGVELPDETYNKFISLGIDIERV